MTTVPWSVTDHPPWRVVVHQDHVALGVRIGIGRRVGDDIEIVHAIGQDGVEVARRPGETSAPATAQDYLLIPEGMAKTLLDELSRHFGGTGDTRQLRRDYDAERGRLDKVTDALITIATRHG